MPIPLNVHSIKRSHCVRLDSTSAFEQCGQTSVRAQGVTSATCLQRRALAHYTKQRSNIVNGIEREQQPAYIMKSLYENARTRKSFYKAITAISESRSSGWTSKGAV